MISVNLPKHCRFNKRSSFKVLQVVMSSAFSNKYLKRGIFRALSRIYEEVLLQKLIEAKSP